MAGADARAPLASGRGGSSVTGRVCSVQAEMQYGTWQGGWGSRQRLQGYGRLLRPAVSSECCAWAADRGCLDWCWGP
eukprot:6763961-Prymnesium_polylepis.1